LARWQEALKRRRLKESSLRTYLAAGEAFEDWLRSSKGVDLDGLIDGDLETACPFLLEYVDHFLGASEGYRRSVIGHISVIFSACGLKLPFEELVLRKWISDAGP